MSEAETAGVDLPSRAKSPASTACGDNAKVSATDTAADQESSFPDHIIRRTVVLDDMKVMYVPVPKAACTSVLWLMAELADIPRERFARSPLPNVSPSMTIHDASLWSPGRRLADYTGPERTRILTEDGWFRFTVVREPAARLWSAWQSKLLMREPGFVVRFGEQPWFPRFPESPAQIIEDFRQFVGALGETDADERMYDVHWRVQHDLLQGLPLNHIGRVELMGDTLAALREHLGPEFSSITLPSTENRMPFPYSPVVYDDACAAAVRERYAADCDHFGYEPVKPAGEDGQWQQWHQHVTTVLPIVRETIERHERIADLHQVVRGHAQERRSLAERLHRARQRTAKLEKRLKHATAERDQARQRVQDGREQIQQARQSRNAAHERLRDTEKRVVKLEERVSILTKQRNTLRSDVRALHSSTSWRITRPIRALGTMARRVKRRR